MTPHALSTRQVRRFQAYETFFVARSVSRVSISRMRSAGIAAALSSILQRWSWPRPVERRLAGLRQRKRVRSGGRAGGGCRACALNKTIPDLSMTGNRERWYQSLEAAKKRAHPFAARLWPAGRTQGKPRRRDGHSSPIG